VLILCEGDPKQDPRPFRMIQCLKDSYQVSVYAGSFFDGPEVKSYCNSGEKIQQVKKKSGTRAIRYPVSFLKLLYSVVFFYITALSILCKYDLLFSIFNKKIFRMLQEEQFDIIITHDLIFFPLAFSLQMGNTKIILDAREYYPKNHEEDWFWCFEKKPYYLLLCHSFLKKCDHIFTVCEGIAQEYLNTFGVHSSIIMSLPTYHELTPHTVDVQNIRIIHHGWANSSRKIDKMIEMMDFLDKRFSLDLMLLTGKGECYDQILHMASTRQNVRIIPPVKMQDIVSFTNQYDIGLYILPPTNFNVKYALPNKIFEFIQARLVVAIGPSIEMSKIVKTYRCGIIAKDFKPQTLAEMLNQLTGPEIIALKNNSDIAAKILNNESSCREIKKIMKEMINV
jgi:hypothetical protein